ncbi:unnamed protein product (macronuclear) [Paramecium tetraurelia]|uniref:EGF-like domain-containing protein n=1 Tax=Paramecium tetraurelia TaxID=5888 RepID=A0DFR1_PARTE|nr:uncharacterized protein GSPATT00016691001 [Paramecium tetraurelia]CAK81878.1 unnamed protein product [Paramecium tetraurelia]|eukprot:XP_001449275.1 hypothetical protein (macronuclear) [Paramecium tetraurelia strain d4-2]
MFHLLCLLIKITNGFPTTDLMEGTGTLNVNWQKQDSSPFTSQFSCDIGVLMGPFMGQVDRNIKKTFTNLQPHYSLQVSLDILYREYWSGISNFVNIIIDSQIIYTDSSITTSNFNTPNDYCKTNAFLIFLYNQQLTTLRKSISHSNANLQLEIKSSFQCSLLSLYTVCEKLLVKNVVLSPQLCHFTCLTCTGPNNNDCLTCPNGTTQNGKCLCQIGYSAYNYQCVQTCPQYYKTQNQECQLNCSLNCQNCVGQKCNTCESGYILHMGQCVTACPKSSTLQSSVCVDYSEQSAFGSQYIGKYFDSLDIDLLSQINAFTFTFNPAFSKLTGQIFSTYNNQYLLGGYGVWSNGQFTTEFNGLPAHNKIRIYLTAWFIDNWTNQQFMIKLDGNTIYQVSYQPAKAINNLFYLGAKDYIENINLSVDHTSNSAQLTFQATLSVSSFQASLALSNIYILIDYCDNNCDVCSNTQCTTCKSPYQLIHNKCGLCDSSNFRNNDCSCQTGYYDDNVDQQCQKCKQECETCLDATSCTQCKLGSNLIILPNCMNCNTGFYYQNGICSKCDPKCIACFGSSKSECLSCSTGQILNTNNECQTCLSNQFIQNNTCQDCQYNCQTCSDTQQCLTCTDARINAPFCVCQIGYYENIHKSCQPCNFRCSTCETSRDNCLTCSGNRQNPPLCNCLNDSGSNDSSIWCTDCDVVNLDVKMNYNSKKLIINFGKKIKRMSPDCSAFFEQSTLQNLGMNPSCFVNSQQIQVLLGSNATIYFGSSINFKKNIIKFEDCQNTLSQFLNNILTSNSDIEAPIIVFSKNSVLLSACAHTPDVIYQIKTQNFGNNQITFIDWRLVRVTKQDPKIIEFLDKLKSQFKNQNQNQHIFFEFTNDLLEMENDILLELEYQNFLGIQGSSFITIKQLSTKLILNVQTQRNEYLTSQFIQISIQVSHCSDVLSNDTKFNISTMIGTLKKEVEIVVGDYYNYTIEPYLLNTGLYQLNIQVSNQETIDLEQNFQIYISSEQPELELATQSNFLGYSQQLNIFGKMLNAAQQNQVFNWDCFDLTSNSECLTQNQSLLILPDSSTLTIQPNTLIPFSIYLFVARYQDLQQQITITVVESSVQKYNMNHIQILMMDTQTTMINYFLNLNILKQSKILICYYILPYWQIQTY